MIKNVLFMENIYIYFLKECLGRYNLPASQFPCICCSCPASSQTSIVVYSILQERRGTIVTWEDNGPVDWDQRSVTYQKHEQLHFTLHASTTGTNGLKDWLSHFHNHGQYFFFLFKKGKYHLDCQSCIWWNSGLERQLVCGANNVRLSARCCGLWGTTPGLLAPLSFIGLNRTEISSW